MIRMKLKKIITLRTLTLIIMIVVVRVIVKTKVIPTILLTYQKV